MDISVLRTRSFWAGATIAGVAFLLGAAVVAGAQPSAAPAVATNIPYPIPGPPVLVPVASATLPSPPLVHLDESEPTEQPEENRRPTLCAPHELEDCAPKGFPAISADGKSIAVIDSGDDGGRGYPNYQLHILDSRTGRRISRHHIITGDEYDDAVDNETNALSPKFAKKLKKRIARAQAQLRRSEYLAMEATDPGYSYQASVRTDSIQIAHTEFGWTVFSESFPVSRAFADAPRNETQIAGDPCYPTETSNIASWVSPQHHVILLAVTYNAPPCHCDSQTQHHVRKLKSPPSDPN